MDSEKCVACHINQKNVNSKSNKKCIKEPDVNVKIGLYGIGGLYNYGCEAIVRGTVILIRNIYPDAQIIYFSRSPLADQKVIRDLDIQVRSITRNASLFTRYFNAGMYRLHIPYRFIVDTWKILCDEIDVVFSIGGDIYTIPKIQRQKKHYRFYNQLVDVGTRVKKSGQCLIIFGASIGPFGSFKLAKNYYIKHLENVDWIYCREFGSISYLTDNLKTQNYSFIPDPAFFVSAYDNAVYNKEYIGVNISPLSIKECYGEISDKCKVTIARMFEKLIYSTGRKIMLIPHVISSDKSDNDWVFMNEILQYVNKEKRSDIVLIDKDIGYINTKKHLRKCVVLVSSRMHCCINAVCEYIPTIFLTYSSKALGMARYIYKDDKWILPIQECEKELVQKVNELIELRSETENFLVERINDIKNDVDYTMLETQLKKYNRKEN